MDEGEQGMHERWIEGETRTKQTYKRTVYRSSLEVG